MTSFFLYGWRWRCRQKRTPSTQSCRGKSVYHSPISLLFPLLPILNNTSSLRGAYTIILHSLYFRHDAACVEVVLSPKYGAISTHAGAATTDVAATAATSIASTLLLLSRLSSMSKITHTHHHHNSHFLRTRTPDSGGVSRCPPPQAPHHLLTTNISCLKIITKT